VSDKTLFQKILDGELPADLVYEDEHCGAFRDIKPQAPTHILIVPRKPIVSIDRMEESDRELLGHLMYVATTIARQEGLE